MSKMPPGAPWGSVTFTGVYWNCEARLEHLLEYVRPWFKKIVIGVQESEDRTLEIAKRYADTVIEDKWHGRGDPTIGKVLMQVAKGNPWAFLISDDEWPSEDLLASFQDLANELVAQKKDGAWVHFKSKIDGFDFTREQDNHLRFFRSNLLWPATPHSRPQTDNTIHWKTGFVSHDRSLDEMMTDYVRRYHLTEEGGWGTTGIQAHNVRMIQGACNAIAERKGWDYVKSFPWWGEVLTIGYNGTEPVDEPKAEEEAVVEAPKPRRRRRS